MNDMSESEGLSVANTWPSGFIMLLRRIAKVNGRLCLECVHTYMQLGIVQCVAAKVELVSTFGISTVSYFNHIPHSNSYSFISLLTRVTEGGSVWFNR